MKKVNQLLFTFILLGSITDSSFGQRVVTGRVVEKETGKPIKEASIILKGTKIETVVNALGFFQLQIDSVDVITIKSPDYDSVDVRIPNVNSFKIELVKSSYSSSEFVVQENQKVYLDGFGFESDKANAKSYRVVVLHPTEPNKLLVKVFGINDVVKQIGTYSDNEIYTRDGFFTLFHSNGQKKEEGFYKDNSKVGKWIKWYKNGRLKEEGFYNDSKDRTQRFKVNNFYDSLGNKLVTDGNGVYITDEDEPLNYAKGQLENDLKTGKWIGYFTNGEVAFEEDYLNGKLVKGVSYDSLRKEYKYDKVFEDDRQSMESFYNSIAKNLKYPPAARNSLIQGKVVVHIVIDSQGKIIRSRIAKGLESSCDTEALRVVTKYDGKWRFGKERGQTISIKKTQSMYLPILFKLDY
ncbi:MAG: TonB family protein [Cyclobacteriaceae bacterium]|nr:TonB family protein [Cyclobacteriaceae bacterium]